jgi:hypothetical protein
MASTTPPTRAADPRLADPGLADLGLADLGLADLGASLDRQLADLLDILGIQPTRALCGAQPQPAATVRRVPRRARAASGTGARTQTRRLR